MAKLGDVTTRLVVLRGNSGSGKTTTAREIRRRLGRGVAWIGQDYLRRTMLREHDRADAPNIGLIDLSARYALDQGYHVILEGGFYSPHYGAMLRRLIADHAGLTGVYYFQLALDETLRRHATRPLANTVTPEQLRSWYHARDLLGVPDEQVIDAYSSLDQTVERIIRELSWAAGGATAHSLGE